jgi:hypothetical protein
MSLRFVWIHGARGGTARGAAGKRQQSDVAGALDGHTEPALVTRADASHAARQNLAALLHELGKNVGALVVDQIDLFDTELADFLFAEELALAARPSTRTATWAAGTTRTAFTASATTTGTTFATATAATVSAMTAMATARAAFAPRRWR